MSNLHAVLSPRLLQALRLTGADHPTGLGRRTCFGLVCCLLGAADALALSITGVVTTERGAAIEGATVQVSPQGADGTSDAPAASATTDERGRFAIADVLAGTYRVAVEADGFAPHDLPSLAVREDGAALMRVALAPAVFIQGVVANAKDEVVADAVVATERPGGRRLQTRTDAKGRFRLEPLARGDKVRIDVRAADVGNAWGWEAIAPRDDLRIRIRGTGALRGLVVDGETGAPLETFRVEIAGPMGSGNTRARQFRSANGSFVWETLPPGRFAATVSAEGYQLHAVPAFELRRDGTEVALTIAMNPGAVVRGHVFDAATGLPVAGALVTARAGEWVSYRPLTPSAAAFGIDAARTDANGAFVLRQLPREAVTVRVRATGYLSETAVAQPHDSILDFELSTGATVRGQLVDADGLATDGVVVLWYPLSAERRSAAATAQGGFAFEQVAGGRYRLWGHTSAAAERWPLRADEAGVEVVVPADGGAVAVEIALERAQGCELTGTVRGLLVGESAHVELTHFNRQAQRRQVAHADAAGRFALSVRRGTLRARARTSAGRMLAKRVHVSCIHDEALDFHFNGRSRLYGTVTRQGDPAHATVRVQSLAADARRCGFGAATSAAATPRDCGPIFDASATTSPSGQYAIRGLRDGSYLLEVVGAGHRREVRVASDTRVDVRLRDHERQVDFAGVVTAADTRQPLAGVYVSLRDSTDETSGPFKATARRTDSRGAFSMRVTPGTYRVFAHKTGFAAVWRHQTLATPITDIAIALRPAAGAPVRVTDAQTGQPLPYVALGVGEQGVPLRLTSEGTATLWRELEGRDLLFRHPNYEQVKVPRWDGSALHVRMISRSSARPNGP